MGLTPHFFCDKHEPSKEETPLLTTDETEEEMEENTGVLEAKPKGNGLIKPASSLAFLADQGLVFERSRVAAQVRVSHLKLKGRNDPITEELGKRAHDIERFATAKIVELVKDPPTYPWWSRVTGAYPTIVGKIIGLIESFGKFYPVGDPLIPAHLQTEDGFYKRQPVEDNEGNFHIWVEGIERLPNRAAIMTLGGVTPDSKKVAGELLPYIDDLKMMLHRFMFYGCILTGNRYKDFYDRYKVRKKEELINSGMKILPTPKGKFCEKCLVEREVPATTRYCPECDTRLSGKQEPEGILWLGHFDNICKRKIKVLFICHLWEVWRAGLGLPTGSPYPIEKLGHTTFISPWEMCDLPAEMAGKTANA